MCQVGGKELHKALILKKVMKGNNRYKMDKFRFRRWEINVSEIGQWMNGTRKTDCVVDTNTTQRFKIG